MSQPLLATKLHVPSNPPYLITRARLIEQLNTHLLLEDAFQRKLTLISAPAGYGKTTATVDWLTRTDIPFTWLSLDSGDNDPVRFFTYLTAALQQADAGLGETVEQLLHSGQLPPPEVLLTELINDIVAGTSPLILALDDYHEIVNPMLHQALAFLLEHQPWQIHLVLITREDPPLPLARLRSREQVNDVRQQDLRFTATEVTHYLQDRLEIEFSAADIQTLQSRIEGWPVGLQLTCLLLQGHTDIHGFLESFTGSSRYIMDYLLEEVLGQQSSEVQEFLLQTSLLDRFCAPLCNAVTGRSDSRETLQFLEQANLFLVPLDHTREWYRYHRLFADLLRHRQRTRAQSTLNSLHAQASLWFETQEMYDEAIHHAVAAMDWPRAGQLILDVSETMLKRGEVVTLLGWFQQLPEEVIQTQPALCMEYIWPLLLVGQLDAAEATILHLTESTPDLAERLTPARAYLAWLRGDIPRAIALSQQVLTHGEQVDTGIACLLGLNLGISYWHAGQMREAGDALADALRAAQLTDNHYAALTARFFLARIQAVRGQLRRAAQLLEELLQAGEHIPVTALVYLDLGCLCYEWNDLNQAAYYMERSLDLSTKTGNAEFQAAAYLALACLKLGQGDTQAAEEAARSANQLASEHGATPQMFARIAACLALVALAQDDVTAAKTWAERMPVDADLHSFYRNLNLTNPRIHLACGNREQAAEELGKYHKTAAHMGWDYGVIALRILQAMAASTPEDGAALLAEALQAAQPEGLIRTFVDAGPGLVPLLKQAARQGVQPEYVGAILAIIRTDRVISHTASPGQPEPLSERELEVLRLVVAGLTNPEIAEQLVISLGTVKTHVHNIYAKLGARNRAEAIARSNELNLWQ